jgi:CDP-4-dehydro-6-deoxyglucose reductase, E3
MSELLALTFEGTDYSVRPGETVLSCLERHGVTVPSFCRAGVCQACVLKAVDGALPSKAQAGLKDNWKRQGLFLSCVCAVDGPLHVTRTEVVAKHESRVVAVNRLTQDTLCIMLSRPLRFEFSAGQFVQLQRPMDGATRPYSIASLPTDEYLEFHVRVLPGGTLSQWFIKAVGEAITILGPMGECTYIPDEPERVLVLAATGTGLAPLVGVVRAARVAQHRGPVHLYHGARTPEELYYLDELERLSQEFESLQVTCVCMDGVDAARVSSHVSLVKGDLVETVLMRHPKPADQRSYLCGNPAFVQKLKKKLYLAGASLSRIHSDPFLPPAGER